MKIFTLAALLLGVNMMWGQTTVSYNFADVSGDIDSNISFTSAQNNGTNAPFYGSDGTLRLYYATNGNGGSITLTPANGVTITKVILTAPSTSYTPIVKYNVNGGNDIQGSWSSATYTINNITASTSLKIRNANTSSTQLRFTKIEVTYSGSGYNLTYDGNNNTSGSAPASSNYASGATATVASNTGNLTRTGFTFSGWNTLANGTGTNYSPGSTFAMPSNNVTLYARWTANPSLTATPTALTGFSYIEGNGPSASQNFSVTGSNLTAGGGTITIMAPANYEISTDNIAFGTSASVNYTGTSLAATTVYVHLKSGLLPNPSYSGAVSISGGGATGSVAVSGNVISSNHPPVASNATVSGTYIVGQILTGTYTYSDNENDPQGTATYKWYAATSSQGTGAAVISGASSATFALTSAQNGRYIRLGVTPVATAGTSPGTEVFSAWAGPVTTATLAANPTSLTGFNYVEGSGPSASQSFSLSGSSLTGAPGNITVSGSAAYEVSLSATTDFGASVTIPYSGFTLATVPVYVRLKAGLSVGNYNNQTIAINGGNASASVTVSGNVVVQPPINDLCTNATVLPLTNIAIQGTMAGSTYTTLTNTTNSLKDVWYVITPTCTGNHTVTLPSGYSGDLDLFLYGSACPSSVNGYVASSSNGINSVTESFTANLTSGVSYYLRVAAYNSLAESTNFSLVATAVVATPTLAANSSSGVTYQSVSISAGATTTTCSSAITSYGVYYSTTSGFANGEGTLVQSTNLNNGPFIVFITGLTPNTQYYYKVYATNASGTTYSSQSTFTTAPYIVNAPVAIAATSTNASSFTANWNTVSNATAGYKLDVSLHEEFRTGQHQTFNEDFSEEITGPAGYKTGSTEFPTGIWSYESAIKDATSGTNLQLRNGDPGKLFSPTFAKITSITITARSASSTSSILVQKIVNGVTTELGSVNLSSQFSNTTFQLNDSNVKIAIINTGSRAIRISNITIESEDYTPSFVTGYENLTVADLHQTVSGLAENTTYYYRVRAVNSTYNITSPNSNVIKAKTSGNFIWNGTQWTGNATPTEVDNGTIAAEYNTAVNGGFTIGNLMVNSDASVNVAPNTTLTVAGNLINNAGAANFTIQDNGALVQTGNGTATGDITVFKYSNDLYRLDYTLWSSPVVSQKLRTFSMGTSNNRFYEYKYDTRENGTTFQGYWNVDPLTTYFEPAKSFLIRMPNSIAANQGTTTPAQYADGEASFKFEGVFAGTPNTGTVTYPLTSEGNLFTAVGNPYPSPIGIADFFETNRGVLQNGSALYFWRKRNNNESASYATISAISYAFNESGDNEENSTGGQVNLPYLGGAASTWKIAPAQGFFVKTQSGLSNARVTFNNAMRKSAGNSAFFREGRGEQNISRYWINLKSGNAASQLSVAYAPEATNGIDYGYDGFTMADGNSLSVYTLAENKELTIQARPEFNEQDAVMVGYNAPAAGTYTLSLNNADGVFASGQKIYVKDNAEGITRELNRNSYTFTTEAGTFNNRFEFVYKTTALGTDNPVIEANSIIVYKNNHILSVTSNGAIINSITVYDIRGRRLLAKNGINANTTTIEGLNVQNEVLIIEVNTEKGSISKKIIF